MRTLRRIFNVVFTIVFTSAILVSFVLLMTWLHLVALRFVGASI